MFMYVFIALILMFNSLSASYSVSSSVGSEDFTQVTHYCPSGQFPVKVLSTTSTNNNTTGSGATNNSTSFTNSLWYTNITSIGTGTGVYYEDMTPYYSREIKNTTSTTNGVTTFSVYKFTKIKYNDNYRSVIYDTVKLQCGTEIIYECTEDSTYVDSAGEVYNCNPNDNTIELIENSNGVDDSGAIQCNEGYKLSTFPAIDVAEDGEIYNVSYCVADDATEDGETPEDNSDSDSDSILNNIDDNTSLTNDKLDSSNEKLDTANTKLTDINSKLSDVNSNLQTVDNSVDELKSDLNEGFGTANDHLEGIGDGVADMNENLEGIGETNENILDSMNSFFSTFFNTEADSDINDPFSDDISTFEGVMSQYDTFYDNLQGQYQGVISLGDSAKNTIENGFTNVFNSNTNEIVTCSESFTIDFSSIGGSSIDIDIDACYITSMLRPIFYPMFYIVFSVYVLSFAFSLFRGVL